MTLSHPLRRLISSLLLAAILVSPYAVPLSAYAQETEASESQSSSEDSEPSDTASASDEAPVEDAEPQSQEEEIATEPDLEITDPPVEETQEPEAAENGGSGSDQSTATPEATVTTTQYGPLEVTTIDSASSTPETAPAPVVAPESPTEPQPTIVSGRSVALANVLNIVNTNFVNSEGAMVFSNFIDPVLGSVDFRDTLPFLQGGACGLMPCFGGDHVSVSVNNDAHINNAIVLHANSGQNEVEGGEIGSITTGDAYAGLNLINLANTNIIDSNYLLVTMNAFQGIRGDVVFPSFASFFSSLMHSGSDSATITNTNTADIENLVAIDAATGNNTVNGANASSITTGASVGSASVFNQINTNQIGNGNFSILFRVHGNWAGEVFGAPDNLAWSRSSDGSIFMFDSVSAESGGTQGSVAIDGVNNASIRNDVSVIALTGENAVTDSSTALIATGDAYAGANIVNIANTNIVGRNWILAIVNIFGDFEGDIAFGRPDLWVGEQVSVPGAVENGSELEYKFSVINNGDSVSSQTVLKDEFDVDHIEIIDSSLPYDASTPGTLIWNLGTIPSGQATEVTYRARVKNADEGTPIVNVVQVNGYETDNNSDDNTDTATVVTYRYSQREFERPFEKLQIDEEAGNLSIEVRRSDADISIRDGLRTVRQEIVVTNKNGTSATAVVVHDILHSADGILIQDEVWDLGTVLPNEEITLGYDIVFADDTPVGTYRLSTSVEGTNIKNVTVTNGSIRLDRTASEVPADPPGEQGEVLGVFLEALGVETARAAEDGNAPSNQTLPWWQFFFLGALLSLAYVTKRHGDILK